MAGVGVAGVGSAGGGGGGVPGEHDQGRGGQPSLTVALRHTHHHAGLLTPCRGGAGRGTKAGDGGKSRGKVKYKVGVVRAVELGHGRERQLEEGAGQGEAGHKYI